MVEITFYYYFFHLAAVAVGDEELSFPLYTGELQGVVLFPPALGVANLLQAPRVTNAEPEDFVIALEIPGVSTDLREERKEKQNLGSSGFLPALLRARGICESKQQPQEIEIPF